MVVAHLILVKVQHVPQINFVSLAIVLRIHVLEEYVHLDHV